jgi:hypothetical protein
MGENASPYLRPYFTSYAAEQIINWRTIRRDGQTVLTMVVLSETIEEPSDDYFKVKFIEQYRVLELDADGIYRSRIWRESSNRKEYEIVSEFVPTRRGDPLNFIPFTFVGPTSINSDIEKPPLLDLADVNLSHYRSSADLEHGRHWSGLPTLFFSGFDESDEVVVGSSQAIISKKPDARASFIEFSGQGLGAIERALEEKEQKMAALGARLLENPKAGVESAKTVELRQTGEASVLKAMAATTSHALTRALKQYLWWQGVEADASVRLNTDFFEVTLSSAELRELIMLWQGGGISYGTLYANLQRGKIARPGISAEQERHIALSETNL